MLELLDFRLYSGDTDLLRAEYFSLPAAAKYLLVGANGTGKTLLLQSICGEYRAWDGDITIKGEPAGDRKTILLDMPLHLLPAETVWQNLLIPLPRPSERLKGRLVELSAIASIADLLKRKAEYLSYSAGKFVELIRAVVQLPHIILIDDIDHYFDDENLAKAMAICAHAAGAGSIVLATASRPLPGFDVVHHISGGRLEALDAQ
ncbi:MAG: ATP-binding cassette domain-containing protein [Candidatus Cloacimonetes bacterium]|nr:ATP-binding cassette domain-containing protein [Candidatus Cloacimonadota bacterium]